MYHNTIIYLNSLFLALSDSLTLHPSLTHLQCANANLTGYAFLFFVFKHLLGLFFYPMISSWYVGTTLIITCCLFLLLSYHLPKQLKPLMLPWQPCLSQWFSWAGVAGLPLLLLIIVSLSVIYPSIPLSPSAFLCSPLPLSQLLKVL